MFNTTFILILSLIGFFLLAILLWSYALRLGLKWLGADEQSWPTIFKAGLIVQTGTILINVLLLLLNDRLNPMLLVAMQLILVVAFGCAVLSTMFSLSLGKSLLAWLVTLGGQLAVFIVAAFVFKPYVFEAFRVPTNSMAPTILGHHARVACPVCGKPAFGTVPPKMKLPYRVICEEFHISNEFDLLRTQPEIANGITKHALHSCDHVLAAKFLQPRRWDLITFLWPEDPEVVYVKRLIGLPGESIVIREGSVWANGEKLEPPPELQGIKYYLEEMENYGGPQLHGSEVNPAKLGPDEYFVLGDFTAAAADSRYWQRGAPGHPPYAVPADYLTGVVTHTFWPWSRLKSFEQH
jgi:signal peptidase I